MVVQAVKVHRKSNQNLAVDNHTIHLSACCCTPPHVDYCIQPWRSWPTKMSNYLSGFKEEFLRSDNMPPPSRGSISLQPYSGLATFENCLAWGSKTWTKKIIFCSSFCCVHQIVYLLIFKKWQAKKKVIFFLDAWDFTCLAGCFALMREILHAWHESVRNGVQARDSRPMRESWQPCHTWPLRLS